MCVFGRPGEEKSTGGEGCSLALVADPDVIKDVFPRVYRRCAVSFVRLAAAFLAQVSGGEADHNWSPHAHINGL